jgi:hypothetical protein
MFLQETMIAQHSPYLKLAIDAGRKGEVYRLCALMFARPLHSAGLPLHVRQELRAVYCDRLVASYGSDYNLRRSITVQLVMITAHHNHVA